jgi:lactoylglutathione lyase
VVKDDYAKWMLEDPRVNFAISQRGGKAGVNHLGLQTDSDAELEVLHAQLQQAEVATQAEKDIGCCYARSNKYWVTDPTGIAWETFHTLGTIPTFGAPEATPTADSPASCCAPAEPVKVNATIAVKAKTACCS